MTSTMHLRMYGKGVDPKLTSLAMLAKAVIKVNQFIQNSGMVIRRPITTDAKMSPEDAQEMYRAHKVMVDLKEQEEKIRLAEEIKSILNSPIADEDKTTIITATIKNSDLEIKNFTVENVMGHLKKAELKEKQQILGYYQSQARTTLGTCEESTVEDMYFDRTGRLINENNTKTLVKKYRTAKNIKFVVKGRIDGLVIDYEGQKPFLRLIEIKNRSNRLFGVIPQYEKMQINFYLRMLGLEHGELVERFKNDMNILEYEYDSEIYDSTLRCLSRTVDFMVNMWDSADQIMMYQQMNTDERKDFLNKNMPLFVLGPEESDSESESKDKKITDPGLLAALSGLV